MVAVSCSSLLWVPRFTIFLQSGIVRAVLYESAGITYTALFNAVVNQAVYAAQFDIYVLELNISVATDISPQGAKDVLKSFLSDVYWNFK